MSTGTRLRFVSAVAVVALLLVTPAAAQAQEGEELERSIKGREDAHAVGDREFVRVGAHVA